MPSILEYSALVLAPNKQQHINALENVQKRAAIHCKKGCAEAAHLGVLFEYPKIAPFVLFPAVLLQLRVSVLK